MMAVPRLLHVTVLRVGDEIASSHIGVYNKDQVLLGMLNHSPFFASVVSRNWLYTKFHQATGMRPSTKALPLWLAAKVLSHSHPASAGCETRGTSPTVSTVFI
jgi:hypothetical protein